jgi:hypothetical protein
LLQYYAEEEELVISSKTKSDENKINLLSRICDYSIQSITGSNPILSYTLTKNTLEQIAYNLLETYKKHPSLGDQISKDVYGDLNEGGAGKGVQALMDQLSDSQKSKIIKKSLEESQNIENHKNELNRSTDDKSSNGSSNEPSFEQQINLAETYKKIMHIVENSTVRKSEKFLKSIMNTGFGNFKDKSLTKKIPLMDAEVSSLSNVRGIENLFSPFFIYNLDDVHVIESSHTGDTDIYIDCSGSVSTELGNMMKAFAYKLMRMRYVNKVYFFDMSIHGPFTKPIDVMSFNRSGGTSFKRVIENVQKTGEGRNTLVLTDGEDRGPFTYLPNIYWVGIGSSITFKCFDTVETDTYVKNKQCATYFPDTGKMVVQKSKI